MEYVILGHYDPLTVKNLIELGISICVIHPNDEISQILPAGAKLIVGSFTDNATLLEAEIDSASVFMALSEDDERNLNSGLIAKQLNPQIRVVIRMFNPNLANRLNQLYEDFFCVSTSFSISPAFAFRLIFPNYCGFFYYDEEYHVLTSYEISTSSPLLGKTGLSFDEGTKVLHSRGDEEVFDPMEEMQVGDTVVMVKRLGGKTEVRGFFGRCVANLKSRLEPIKTFVKEYMFQDTLFRVSSVLIGSILLFSLPYFYFVMDLNFVDGLYFAITILTTIGFGDISFINYPHWAKIVGIVVMLISALIMALVTATVTNFFMSERLARTLAQFQIPRMSHFITCGLGQTGSQVLKILQKVGVPIIGIELDSDNQFLQELKTLKIPVVQGNVKDITILERVNIRTAKAILSLTPDELVNLETSLNAIDLNPQIRTIIRMEKMASGLGSEIESPKKLSSYFFLSAALGLHSIGIMEQHGNPFLIFQINAELYPRLLDHSLADIATEYELKIILHSTEWDYLNSLENKNLRSGEWAICIGRIESILALHQGKPLSGSSHQVLIEYIPPGQKNKVVSIVAPGHHIKPDEIARMLDNLPCAIFEQVSLSQARAVVNKLKKLGVFAHAIKNQQTGVDELLENLGL